MTPDAEMRRAHTHTHTCAHTRAHTQAHLHTCAKRHLKCKPTILQHWHREVWGWHGGQPQPEVGVHIHLV